MGGEDLDEMPPAGMVSDTSEDETSASVGLVTAAPVDDEAFETLAAEIKEVLAELAQDKAMDAFRGEYEKLFAALEKSHANEKRLDTKCGELASEIANQQARVDAAHDKLDEDQSNIASLKKEIEKAWKMVDMTQEREERARETIETLNTEIQNLTKVIEEKTLGAEDTNLNELRKLRDELTTQRDNLKADVKELTGQLGQKDEEIAGLKADKAKLEGRIVGVSNDLQSRTNEMNREIRRKERTEREVKQLRTEVEAKVAEIAELAEDSASVQESVGKLEDALVEQRKLNDGLQYNLETLQATISDLEGQLETQAQTVQQMEAEAAKRADEISEKERVISQAKLDVGRGNRELEELRKKVASAEKGKTEVEHDRTTLKGELAGLMKQIEELKHAALVDKRRLDEKRHEISVLQNGAKRSASGATKLHHELQTTAEQSAEYRRQAGELEKRCEKQARCIATAEAERDHYMKEAQELAKRVDLLIDDVNNADGAVFTYRKELSEMETRLKQQQNLYQAARNDRMMLNKNLTGAQDEISDSKGKLRVLQHQFDQLKEEMVAKEAALAKDGHEQQKLIKEKEDLMVEVEKVREETRQVKGKNKEVEKNFGLMQDRYRLQQADLEKTRSQLKTALRERSLADSRLSKKAQDWEQLSRRSAIQEKAMARGESEYLERVEDICVLKLEVKRLKQENEVLSRGTRAMGELRKENLQLQKDLLAERTRVRGLQSEVETPLNVHRWRRLEGGDPSTYELIQKVQSLQKRLIARKEDIVERDLALAVKEKALAELRTALARQPSGDKAADEARRLKAELRQKVDQQRGLEAENNALKSGRANAEERAAKVEEECNEMKKKLLEVTKKYQKLREQAKKRKELEDEHDIKIKPKSAPPKPLVRSSSWTPRKFVGGGFRIAFED